MKHNPYVGPRPYQRADRRNFYGRNREARDLLALILAERVVLFYAPSGAGKTSLLNAKILPALEAEAFDLLPVARVANDLPPGVKDEPIENIFIFSLLLDLAGEDLPLQRLQAHTLASFLQEFYPETEYPYPLLIVDQFEELFTAHRHRWQDAQGFFLQVQAALKAIPSLGIIFAMREDYVAEVDPYAPLLPRRLRARFRMGRLGATGALEVVAKPAQNAGVPFAEGVAEQLVDDLRRSKVQCYGRGEEVEVLGPFVEPVQLQVVCQRLWDNLPEQEDQLIQWEEVEEYGNIDRALVGFYADAVAQVIVETPVRERELRRWATKQLIAPMQTRGLALRGPEETVGLPNAAVDILAARHLIHSDVRAGARWYELVHDRLIDPILQSNRAWEAARQTPLRLTAKRWQETQSIALLYQDEALSESLAWAELHRDELEPYEHEFLVASQTAQQHRQRIYRLRIASITVGLVTLLLVTGLAWMASRNGLQAYSRELAAEADTLLVEDRGRSIQQAYTGVSPALPTWWDRSTQDFFGPLDTTDAQIMLRQAVRDYYPVEIYANLPDQAHAVLYEPQGRFLYAAMPAAGVEEIDTKIGGRHLLLNHQGGAAAALAIDSTGRYLAVGGDDGKTGGVVEIWDREEAAWVATLRVPLAAGIRDEIHAVAYSPHDYYLATGGDYGTRWRDFSGAEEGLIRLWELNQHGERLSASTVFTLPRIGGRVSSLAFSGDATPLETMTEKESWYLAAGSYDNLVHLWKVRPRVPGVLSATQVLTLTGHTAPVKAIAFSPDGKLIVSGSSDKTIRLWDVESGEPEFTLIGHTSDVTSLAFSSDGQYLISGSRDRTVRIWHVDTATPHLISVLTGPGNLVLAVTFSPDDQFITAGAGDQTVRTWNYDYPRQLGLSTLPGHAGRIRAVTYSPDGKFLASAGGEGKVTIWSLVAGTPIHTLHVPGGKIWDLAYSPDGQTLITCSSDDSARVWDASTGKWITVLRGHKSDVERARFTPDGRYLLTVAKDKRALLWDTGNWSLAQTFTIPAGGLWGMDLSPDGHWLALGYLGGRISLHELTVSSDTWQLTSAITLTGQSSYLPALDFSSDGRYLASASWDGTARIWSMETFTTVTAPLEHPGFVYSVAFAPQDDYLATGARDGKVRIWELTGFPKEEPQLVGVIGDHTDLIYDIAFSPDGKYLVSGSWDGSIRRYLVRLEDVLKLAERYIGGRESE
ncbi:MAG: hypothetical protein K8R89_06255 [Anaerolineae bacterium]|nr:hypothetical protein [Anaerolineae bacterium]